MKTTNVYVWFPRRDGSQCRYLPQLSSQLEKRCLFMKTTNKQSKHIRKEGEYTSDDLKGKTLDDGTRIVTSPVTDIKRPVCASVDVHKNILMAAVCKTDKESLHATFFVRQFKTSNDDILKMAEWISSFGAADVCMESTGKYWIPVYDILEHNGLNPVLTHPKYVKQAKGRKTDFRDAIHIANLFRMDLVVPSFIPPADIRDLRELCRYRLKLTYVRTAEKNRFQNSMTISKIRLDSVFTDPFGKSAGDIMDYLLNTEPGDVSDKKILSFVRKGCKSTPEAILESIRGYEFIGAQKGKLKIIDLHIEDIDELIGMIDELLLNYRKKYDRIIRHLTTMIGVSKDSALYILAEIGTDMSVWRDSDSLASWAGLSPANNSSARKKKSTKIGNGGHYLKPLLVQCALAAIKSTEKQPYFHNKYVSIQKRRGHKKAIIAIARKMLVSIYHMIKEDKDFQPVDYEQVVTRRQPKELSLKNVIDFLGERGVDADTIRRVEAQCSQAGSEGEDTKPAEPKKTQKKKQPKSDADSMPTGQKPAKRRGRPPKSRQTEDPPICQPTVATA